MAIKRERTLVENAATSKAQVITDIVCSLLHARIVAAEANRLLCVPFNPLEYESRNSKFLFTDVHLYKKFLQHLNPGLSSPDYRKSVKTLRKRQHPGLIITQRTTSGSTEEFDRYILERFSGPKPPNDPGLLLTVDSIKQRARAGIFVWSSPSEIAYAEKFGHWWLSGPGNFVYSEQSCGRTITALRAFTTETVEDANIIDLDTSVLGTAEMLHMPHGSEMHQEALSVAKRQFYAVRDTLRETDDGQLPNALIDRDLIHKIIAIETDQVRRIDIGAFDLYPDCVEDKINKLMGRMAFRNSLEAMQNQVTDYCLPVGGESLNLSIPCARFPMIVSPDENIFPSFFVMDQDIPGHNIQLARATKLQGYEHTWWGADTTWHFKKQPSRLMTEEPFLNTVLGLSELLRYVNMNLLERMSLQARAFDERTIDIYRFMNATQRLCAVELLSEAV